MSFSVVPAAKMAQGESPFDDWSPADVNIPEGLESDFKGCVWLYQMYVFYIFSDARFGADTAETILNHQAAFLDALAAGSGKQMREGLEKMKTVASALLQNPEMEVDGRKIAVPMEYGIVYAFFPETTWDSATVLVRCLEHGKTSARAIFEPFIEATRIENENAIVLSATQWGR